MTEISEDLAKALDGDPTAKAAFDAMPPSHQRQYLDWITEARKPETRERRIKRALEMIHEHASGG